ncbi:MAG: HAD family hydrolase [Spirochaetaceae bacterium]|jgi:phosphoglycolate phosphatase/putative hydrolase of the HAD superfamily|nr:HAD family hydrolase [Spirochaetaceae bacterium]
MKVYRIPPVSSALIFDMDSTLYTNPEYARDQIDLPIRRLARIRGRSFEDMKGEIETYRETWAQTQGEKISLTNAFKDFGISLEENIRWREELYEPSRYLKPDPVLGKTLDILASAFSFALVTNNPVLIAEKTLAALGIADFFTTIVGLDTCKVSKPHQAPFLKAMEALGLPAGECIALGDRYDFDIAPPLELGMGGILVDGVEDVYCLEEILAGSG